MDDIIDDISKGMISRYSERYKKLGYDVKTLGWGTKEQQNYRFSQVLKGDVDFTDRKVLDIGCGFGDLGSFLLANNVDFKEYVGWDLNPDLINEANSIWKSYKKLSFEVENIASLKPNGTVADIGIMLGVLNLNFKDKMDNYEYSKKLIASAFQSVREVFLVDFLSAKISLDYPKEDFVFYHDPGIILDFALTLTSNVEIKHNYSPIPQKEFMLFIYK